ncbi:TonB-dependent hemoglobin/transferrin/lactoferrin family receptor [Lysobacter pythonis]|uniref:TonB-dependent hemoglobin/transferrin/lactoferrin family receptor n=1 Tax=Solilutibacter pythonis TaxID=2483112 RepID=A0A3M2I6R5_9GAMM|nr:TonB-dependent hemoglobin/transferrin/lactoferrin family receptor [Lysobacter pythonis]RMH94902.1 TonB-dependent hemoglobin/transferrin/lactoferrin family receptor [Lysobacter pythonis]
MFGVSSAQGAVPVLPRRCALAAAINAQFGSRPRASASTLSRSKRSSAPCALLLAASCSLTANLAHAQQAADAAVDSSNHADKVTVLDTITVTATRSPNSSFGVPASVSTVNRGQLDDAQASTVSTVLRTLPNVNYGGGPRPAAQSPAIRGLQGPRIIISVDGARRNNDGGVNTLLLIDPDFIKQVDVVRGPMSAAYGSGGLGGVMAFETIGAKDFLSPDQTFGGRVKAGYRSANEASSTNLSAAMRAGRFDFLASATYRDFGDIRTGAGGEHARYPNDGNLKSGLFKAGFSPSERNRFEMSYQRFADKLVGPTNPGGNLLFPFSQKLKRNQEQYTGSWTFRDADLPLLDGKLTVYQTRFKLNGESRSVPRQPSTSMMTQTVGAGLQNSSRFETGSWASHRLTYGLDFYRDTNENTSAGQANTVLPNGRMRAVGLFVQDEVSILDRWTLIGALRRDDYRLTSPGQNASSHDRVSPKFTLKYQPWEFLAVYGSYGEAFRAPSVTEMFGSLNTNRALFNFRPNPALRPEASKTKEVGAMLSFDEVLGAGDQLRIKASYFTEDVEDMIEQKTVGRYTREAPFVGTGLIFQRLNVAKGQRRGGELEVAYVRNDLALGLGYSRLRSKNAQTGAHLYAPPDKLALGTRYRLDGHWSLHYLGQFVRAQDYDSTLLRRRSGYATHDVGVGYEHRRYRVDVGVTNLFDKEYATYQQSMANTFSYEEGRSVNVTLGTRF